MINRGYDVNSSEWSTAEGKAYFVRDKNQGYLKVSFFGPFYGSYVVFELDTDNYQYAFVTSNTKNFLWLLARTPEVSSELKTRFISHVNNLGFDTDAIIFVDQNHNRNSR
ncbi:MAG: lipocalin family protein [Porticoccaceae bacterium]